MPKSPKPPSRVTRPMLRRICEEVESSLSRNRGDQLFRISSPRQAESFRVEFYGLTAHSACLAMERILVTRGMRYISDLSAHSKIAAIMVPIFQHKASPRAESSFLAPAAPPPPAAWETRLMKLTARDRALTGKVEKVDTQAFLASDAGKKFLAEQAERDAKRKAGRK